MSLNVLIIDDSSVMRKIIARSIREAGLDLVAVVEAENGRDALEKSAALPDTLHLILADVNMPEMNGIEFVREARKRTDLRQIPIVMVTTEPSWRVLQEAIEAGATGYVPKPFTPASLGERLRRVLHRKGAIT
jgi:two-component system chemotaxis response regulator CheY